MTATDERDPLRIADFAEASRVDDWTLRSALVRYAQPEPGRASAVLELVRRTDAALHPHLRELERTGEAAPDVAPLLEVAAVLDRMGDVLASWAIDITEPRPVDELDALGRRAFGMLAELGIPRETRPPRRS